MYYTGIGARNVDSNTYKLLANIAKYMAEQNHFLYSGGANGADEAFELGHRSVKGVENYKVFIPWYNYHLGRDKRLDMLPYDRFNYVTLGDRQTTYAQNFIKQHKLIANFDRLKDSHKKLFTRNVLQVTGPNANTEIEDPLRSELLIYACPIDEFNEPVGGTKLTVRVARELNVPNFNVSLPEERQALFDLIKYE